MFFNEKRALYRGVDITNLWGGGPCCFHSHLPPP